MPKRPTPLAKIARRLRAAAPATLSRQLVAIAVGHKTVSTEDLYQVRSEAEALEAEGARVVKARWALLDLAPEPAGWSLL